MMALNMLPRYRMLFVSLAAAVFTYTFLYFGNYGRITSLAYGSYYPKPSIPYDGPQNATVKESAQESSGAKATNLAPLEKGELLMITASSGTNGFLGIPGLKEMVYENRMTYADKWGYDFMWANISSYDFGEKVYWNKIPILQDALVRYPKAKWIWWMDIDIIIMNMNLDMYTHLLSRDGMMKNLEFGKVINKVGGGPSGWKTPEVLDPEDVNFLIASGGWGMNVGNFLMRRSEWTDWLLEMWADPLAIAQHWTLPENDGWTHMYRNHKIVRDHAGCTNQNALNPYPDYNSLGTHWKKGDPFIHFAGCGSSPKCPGHWDKYWAKKEPYTVPDWITEQLRNGSAHIEDTMKGQPNP